MNQTTVLPSVEINPQSTPTAAVVWLHGLGADGHDFADIVPQLQLPDELAVRFVFPHAPVRPVTLNDGYAMPAWYDIPKGMFSQEDSEGIRVAATWLEALIVEQQRTYNIPASRIVLAGFSQGGAMALYCGLRYPQRLAGIIGLSTYVPLAASLIVEASTANRDVPIFLAHGDLDPLIPVSIAQQSLALLQDLHYPVSWHNYAMPHSVCSEEIADIAQWLRKVLNYRFSKQQ